MNVSGPPALAAADVLIDLPLPDSADPRRGSCWSTMVGVGFLKVVPPLMMDSVRSVKSSWV